MSKFVHRKPVWGWSAILLSTLLLSPMATTTVLYALAHAASAFADAQQAAGRPTAGAGQEVRRSDEQESLRAALSEHRIRVRFDSDPDAVALLFPVRALVLVPDEGEPAPMRAAAEVAASHVDSPAAPRAPPFVSPA